MNIFLCFKSTFISCF